MQQPQSRPRGGLPEVASAFLRLGFTAFGGPAVHISLFHDEFVKRRQWLTDEHFLDLLGATNLIPGPNSTEMAMHIGHVRAGALGLIVGGVCFILPAALIVLALSWVYVMYGTTPVAVWLLYGVKPVVIAIILQAIYALGRKAAQSAFYVALAVGVLALALLGVSEIPLLFGGALLALLVINGRRLLGQAAVLAYPLGIPVSMLVQTSAIAAQVPFSYIELLVTFLKIGATIYGSGYVLTSYLQTEFVARLGWLTTAQLVDAIAIGQFTPGPLFATATFVGYLMAGVPGAALASLGIFLPGFILVALVSPLVPRIRQNQWLSALLDGVNAAAVALMAAVTITLARAACIDGMSIALGVAAAVLLIRFRLNATWLIIGGGIIGVVYRLLTASP
jgi:chromate transporter